MSHTSLPLRRWSALVAGLSIFGGASAQTVQFSYDTSGRLSTVTNSDGTPRTYLYENAGFPASVTGLLDESTHRYSTWGYDSQGRAINATSANGAGATTL